MQPANEEKPVRRQWIPSVMTCLRRLRPASARLILFAALLWAPAALDQGVSAAAEPEAKAPLQVLVISGTEAYLPAFQTMNRAMHAAMEQRHRQPVVWFYEATDAVRLPESGPEFAEFLEKKYRGTRIDAVILVTQSAADLFLPFRSRLWPQAPVIAHSLSLAAARQLPPQPGLFVLPTNWDYLGTLRIARRLQPNARQVIAVVGDSRFDQRVLDSARMTLQPDSLGIPIEFVIGQPPRAVAARLQRESLESIVLFLTFFRDGEGGVHVPRDVLEMLSAASAAPIYGIFDSYVGHGVTAGEMESFAEVGERAAELLVAALAQPATAPAVLSPVPSRCVANARQLERHGLSAHLLPDGCDVRFVEPSFVRRYCGRPARCHRHRRTVDPDHLAAAASPAATRSRTEPGGPACAAAARLAPGGGR